MAAVAPPPFQSLPKSSWGSANGATNGFHSVHGDDGGRMLIGPRKTATRSNSSSSLSSVSSNASTVSAGSVNGNGPTQQMNGEVSRKRPARGGGYVWPGMSKAEPIAGLSNGRAQPVGSVSFHPSATSSIASLQMPLSSGSSNGSITQSFQERSNGARPFADGTPLLCLTPMNGTFERKNLQVPFYPEVIRIGRQTNAKSAPTTLNGFFDSKVLSRQHAEIWADAKGKIWIRDIKSSNGTFVNGQRLSDESKNSEPHELRESDMLELGIDIVSEDQKTVVHHKVAARVEHAGFATGQNLMDVYNLTGDMDPSNPNHLLNGQNGLRRNSAQGPHSGGLRGPNGVALGGVGYQRAQQPFLLGPVNIEQVIKKLSAEHKLAKAQQNELQRSAQFLDSLLSNPQTNSFSSDSKSRDAGSKARFSDPPNPPPSAPLPEKPFDYPAGGIKRADTEKPKVPLSPNGSFRIDPQMATQFQTLSEALSLAKREAEEHRKKLTDMEKLLVEERVRRETAEARAKQLEKEAARPRPRPLSSGKLIIEDIKDEEQSTTPIEEEANSQIAMRHNTANESATSKLLKRLEVLQVEFQQVKQEADKWRFEKEEAERQRDDERKEKVSLMDMVAKHKEEIAKLERKQSQKQARKASPSNDMEDLEEVDEQVELVPGTHRGHSGTIVANGSLSKQFIQGKDGGTLVHSKNLQATPYISAFSVVLLGVAIMTLVNRMSKNEQ